MSYLVLARKYRPKRFKEVIGQEHVVKTLINALKLNKLSHALLFSGIKGTGKTTVARIVAKALNCLNPEEGYEPCNKCLHCEEINKGIYVDVIEIDAASNRGIDQIREIIENLKFAPAKGKTKVYIIDEAHMLTKEASNALLKSLEEPPPHVYFILATTEPNKLLPTILSRCQRYDFRRLDLPLILKNLKSICEKEGVEIEEEALRLIAREAQGSMRDALSLLDQAIAYGCKTREDVIKAFGWHENVIVEELALALLERSYKKIQKLLQHIYEQGIDVIFLMENLVEFFKELYFAKTLGDQKYSEPSPVFREILLEYSKEEIFLFLDLLLKELDGLRRTEYPYFHFEVAMFKLCETEKLVPIKKVLEKVASFLKNWEKEEISEEFEKKKDYEKEEEKPSVSLNKEQETKEIKKEKTWEEFLKEIEKESPSLCGFLNSAKEVKFNEKEIRLIFELTEEPLFPLNMIKEKIEKFFEKPVQLVIEKKENKNVNNLRGEIKNRPEVKLIIEKLGAKIGQIYPKK